jgi:hypothetical protein
MRLKARNATNRVRISRLEFTQVIFEYSFLRSELGRAKMVDEAG